MELSGHIVVFVACGNDLNKSVLYENFQKEYGLSMILLEAKSNILAARLHQSKTVTHAAMDLKARRTLIDECADRITEVLAEQGKTSKDLSGVVTFWDDAVALTARLAQHFGLVTSPPEAIDIAHDKYATRLALEKHGLACPGHRVITTQDRLRLKEVIGDLTFPLVLKPVQGATSIGVYVCHDMEELEENLDKGVSVLTSVYDNSELMGLVFDDSPTSCTKQSDGLLSFVLEEFIDGPEVDIDMIVRGGEVLYAKVSDDWDPVMPWRTETGVNYPSRLPEQAHLDFVEASVAVVEAFGITEGVLHMEMKYDTTKGPTLIECNPRLGGGPCHFFHKELYGVDLALEHVALMCGLKRDIKAAEPMDWGVGLLLYAMESGTVTQDAASTDDFRNCRDSKYIVNLSMPLMEGDQLHGWNSENFPSHAGLLMAKIPKSEMSIEEACDYVTDLRKKALEAIKY